MRLAVYALVGFVLLICALYGWGLILPEAHLVRVSREFKVPPMQVFERITDFAGHPRWRKGVKAVHADGAAGRVVEVNSMGELPYLVVRREAPRVLETRIDGGRELGFGGTWLFEIEELGMGSRLTITERGEVYSPLFRVMGKLFFPVDQTAMTYLEDLARSFDVAR